VWGKRELGRSFYRCPGRGRGREVASTGKLATAGMVAHGGGDGMARADGATGRLGQTGRQDGSGRRKAPNRASERDNGEATGRAVADGDRVASPVTGARKVMTSGTRLPERERSRKSERSVADGWGRAGSGRGEGSEGARRWVAWAANGGKCGSAGEREWGFGPETAQPRGEFFLFFFYFSFFISISHFYFFYLLFLNN
jgi:hypothetical protein